MGTEFTVNGWFAQWWGVIMRERIISIEEAVSLKALEALLQARIGWVDAAVSPFAVAARQELLNPNRVVKLHRAMNPYPSDEKELLLAG